jgi:hypothetical protein
LTLTSPTSGGLSVDIVHSRTKVTEFYVLVAEKLVVSVDELVDRWWSVVVSHCFMKLADENGYCSETQRKRNVRR